MIIALLAINLHFINAQEKMKTPIAPGDHPGTEMLKPPPLSEQQKQQMKELQIAHMKEIQPIQNEIRELKAHYRTLITSTNPNISEINKNIDAQTAVMNKLMKSRASHQQDVRKILTDEQRIFRDMNLEKANVRGFRGNPGPKMRMGNLPGKPGFVCPCMR